MYLVLKITHVVCAVLTISGFLLRGYWMMVASARLNLKVTRVLPHIVDTLFLLSGIAMLWMTALNPFTQGWLVAKFAGTVRLHRAGYDRAAARPDEADSPDCIRWSGCGLRLHCRRRIDAIGCQLGNVLPDLNASRPGPIRCAWRLLPQRACAMFRRACSSAGCLMARL